MPTPTPAPPVEAVVETAVYGADLAAAEAFYAGVLGLPIIAREAGRHVFFRAGPGSVLLVFDPAATLREGGLPPHGSTGPGHLALGVRPESLDEWREHLAARGIAIEHEQGRPPEREGEAGPPRPTAPGLGRPDRRRRRPDGRVRLRPMRRGGHRGRDPAVLARRPAVLREVLPDRRATTAAGTP
ncbi:VOC family protein [Gemmata sp.]|uniref:VOC family protein n=1 Tax=Gemmata sp. TaxID=1914242 RepID=UPI003F7005DE